MAVIVGGFGGLIYTQTEASLQEDTESEMEHATVLQAQTIQERLASNQRQTVLLSQAAQLQEGDPALIEPFLETQLESMDDAVLGIHYVDTANGTIDASTVQGASGSIDEPDWQTEGQRAPEPVLVGPYQDQYMGSNTGAIVLDIDETTRLVVLFDMATISEQLTSPTQSDSASTQVMTEQERKVVLSHETDRIGKIDVHHEDVDFPDESGYVEVDMGESEHGDHGDMDGMETVDYDHGDQVMVMGYAKIEGTDWVVMSHESKQKAFALQSDITRSLIGLIAVAVLGLGLIGLIVGRNTSSSLQDLASRANELEAGNLDVDLDSSRVDEIGQLYDAFDSMRRSLATSLEDTEAARQRAEARSDDLAELATHLETKAESFSDVMDDAADGDMTARMDETSQNEAMADIACEYNQMMDEIAATTDELKRFAEEVAAHSQQVTASAQEVQTASSQVTDSVQRISSSTEDQHETFRTVSSEMDTLAATTEEVASLADEVSGIAERTADAGQAGRTAASDAIEAMDAIDDDANTAVSEIERLQAQIEEIEEIAEFIQEVAKQTNMLALNANIEASRSGEESDEGFSVVAEEVKELAMEVQESAEEIDTLVDDVQRQGDRTADEIRDTRERVIHGAETVSEAVDALDEIATFAEETSDGTAEISAASQQQAASIQDVVALVEEAETASEQVSTEASTAAAAAEEQTTALSEVTESAGDLAQRSGTLQERLDTFDTPGDTASPPEARSDD